jgi:undecaprenyl-diphosphatase
MHNTADLFFIFGAKYLYLVVIIIASFWLLMQPRSKQKEILILACICLPLIFAISLAAGHLYYNPRPFVAEGFKPLIPHKANNGFPSHHVLLVSAISAVIFPFSRRISMLLWILTLFIGFSRVYVGMHYIIDVMGSILISIAPPAIVYFFMRYLKNRKSEGGAK